MTSLLKNRIFGKSERQRMPALREPNYRLLLLGDGLSHLGDMMEHVARGWLVFELTDSALALGVTAFSAGLPRLLLGLAAGVLADRLDRRRVLSVCAWSGLMVQAIFATLVLSGLIQLWQVLLIVLVTSVVHTMNQVTRQALIPELVGRDSLPNAIAVFTTLRGTIQILGPSLAGALIVVVGVAGVLYLNATSFLAMLVALRRMRIAPSHSSKGPLGFREDVTRGLRYVWEQRDVLAVMVLALVPITLLLPYRTLMPVFARDILQVGPAGYGLLMAAPGIGGVVASAGVTLLEPRRRGLLMVGSVLLASLSMLAFAALPWFLPALLCLAVWGIAFNVYRVMNHTVLQLLTPRDMIGRVMGVYQTDRGLRPLGDLLLGSLAGLFGTQAAISVAAAICALFTLLVLGARPSLRKL